MSAKTRIKKIPFAHQERGAKYLFDRYSGFLFFKMRMGKTLTSILAMKQVKLFPVLIICPKIVLDVWREALLDEGAKPETIAILDGSKSKNHKLINTKSHITICNFEKAKNYDILNARKWMVVIIDESHRLANEDSQVTRYFRKNPRPEYQRRWGLTGTPAPETYLNYVTQYLIVFGSFMGYKTYNSYLLDHWVKNEYSGKWEVKDARHLDAITNYVKNTACIATMADIDKGAKFVFSKRWVPMNATQIKLYEKAENVYRATMGMSITPDGLDAAKMVKRLHQKLIAAGIDPYDNHAIISRNKAVECVEYWQYVQEPLLIVSAYREPIVAVVAEFEKVNARVGVIHGDVKYEDREKIRKNLMEGKLDVVVAQTKSIEVGLDFSVCNIILVVCNSDSGGSREQLIERINHMNATSPKEIIDIMSEGSNDDMVYDALVDKSKNSMSIFRK